MERETGIEPATNSLEGCDSTIELLPHTAAHGTSRSRVPILRGNRIGQQSEGPEIDRTRHAAPVIGVWVPFGEKRRPLWRPLWLTTATLSDKICKVLIYQRFVGDGSRRTERLRSPGVETLITMACGSCYRGHLVPVLRAAISPTDPTRRLGHGQQPG